MAEVMAEMRVGPPEAADRYVLRERISEGGEGEVWLAATARRDGDTEHRWAVKVLHAKHLSQEHYETPDQALGRWYRRAQEARDETSQLVVPGVVGATEVFVGAPPHAPGFAEDSRTLYVVSRWIDGDDLTRWVRKRKPSFADICEIARQLAEIIDTIGTGPLAVHHRDISPSNVMVNAAGQVHLIDFTFVVPTRSGPVTRVGTSGFTAPEGKDKGTAEADRYSFGAVVYFLLMGQAPQETDAASTGRNALRRADFPDAVAGHIAALLATDPNDRPRSLRAWAAALRAMTAAVDAQAKRPRIGDLDLAVDGTGTPTVVAIGAGVKRARLAAGSLWTLVPDAAAPDFPVGVRAAVDGAGAAVQFVIDRSDRLWVGRSARWHEAGIAVADGGIAVVRQADGAVTAFVVDPDGMLTAVTAGVGAPVRRIEERRYVRKVLAAALDSDGRPAIAVITPDDELAVTGTGGLDRLHPGSTAAAGLCLSSWGELQCHCVLRGSRELIVFEQRYGVWNKKSAVELPGSATDIACVGQRDGVTVAIAGDDGLWVTTSSDAAVPAWQRLAGEPSHRVALGVGAAWRLRLAAVLGGHVAVATEDFTGSWPAAPRKI
ncbi:serine/threonine protein kinase [Amycolatopsis sp. lyj-109]|uniref:serine/threonine protein kinase n=1 Tax=Amycolatopsis sp. lyj-109 TaxID=2789287 RepID=UPI00397BB34C